MDPRDSSGHSQHHWGHCMGQIHPKFWNKWQSFFLGNPLGNIFIQYTYRYNRN
jgi:hypothetical protein